MKRQREASTSRHAAGAVRHAEKRRTGTCAFADRVARISLDTYRSTVPKSFRDTQKQTCMATIVAHFASAEDDDEGYLQVMAMGVGTKFLPEAVLRQEERVDMHTGSSDCSAADTSKTMKKRELRESFDQTGYGMRVRDCHAEVLARRAFRRQLCLEIQRDLHQRDDEVFATAVAHKPILERCEDESIRYRLLPNVTLHMYTSSAPCGNATLKKFMKMEKETFNDKLGSDEWPAQNHNPIPPHSLRLGQFALLVKKDNSINTEAPQSASAPVVPKGKPWPANQSDTWCPPGTSIVRFNKGSLHTCSDKMCRWNCLGLQGSLLASILFSPLYMSTLTVGRKLTECICRRAVCCRALPPPKVKPINSKYALNHPAIMGTGVYMDESGVIGMSDSSDHGQDVRFNSTLCWAWWPSIGNGKAECIDGATGFVHNFDGAGFSSTTTLGVSMVSTETLLRLFCGIDTSLFDSTALKSVNNKLSLADLRAFKCHISPDYEAAKDELMTRHRIFRQWRRRENEGKPS